MSASELSVNACVDVAEHAHYKKKRCFQKANGSDVSRVLSQAKKKKVTASAHSTAKNFVVCLNETFKISLIIL